jgi:hypothetical protein
METFVEEELYDSNSGSEDNKNDEESDYNDEEFEDNDEDEQEELADPLSHENQEEEDFDEDLLDDDEDDYYSNTGMLACVQMCVADSPRCSIESKKEASHSENNGRYSLGFGESTRL